MNLIEQYSNFKRIVTQYHDQLFALLKQIAHCIVSQDFDALVEMGVFASNNPDYISLEEFRSFIKAYPLRLIEPPEEYIHQTVSNMARGLDDDMWAAAMAMWTEEDGLPIEIRNLTVVLFIQIDAVGNCTGFISQLITRKGADFKPWEESPEAMEANAKIIAEYHNQLFTLVQQVIHLIVSQDFDALIEIGALKKNDSDSFPLSSSLYNYSNQRLSVEEVLQSIEEYHPLKLVDPPEEHIHEAVSTNIYRNFDDIWAIDLFMWVEEEGISIMSDLVLTLYVEIDPVGNCSALISSLHVT